MDGFRFDILGYAAGDLLLGAWITLRISAVAFVFALALGTAVGVARSRSPLWRRLLGPYVEVLRGTPLLIQLFFLYYGLPTAGLNLDSLTASYLGLGLNGGAYISEIVRGALAGVDRGQEEAALSTGLSACQALAWVILPQALRMALPPLVNSFSALLKDSSLVSVLAITELTRIGQLVYTRTFRAFEIYLAVGLMYFLMTWAAARLSRGLERRFGTVGSSVA